MNQFYYSESQTAIKIMIVRRGWPISAASSLTQGSLDNRYQFRGCFILDMKYWVLKYMVMDFICKKKFRKI